jgi:hypothetical protein
MSVMPNSLFSIRVLRSSIRLQDEAGDVAMRLRMRQKHP